MPKGKKKITITNRPCATHQNWDDMTLEEKVETLAHWGELVIEWAEGMYEWTHYVKNVMVVLNKGAREVVKVTDPFVGGKDINGGPPPPKKPKEPDC